MTLNVRTPGRDPLPPTAIALGVTSFLTDAGSEMIFPLLPVFVASLGGSAAFLGLVEGLADATSSLLKLGSGYVADRVDRRKPLVLFGYGLAAAARPLIALATSPWHVLAVRMADRVGKGIRGTPRDVLLAAAASSSSAGRVFGFHRAMDHAGAVVGPLLAAGLLALGTPLRTLFALSIVPGVLSVASVLLVREPSTRATRVVSPEVNLRSARLPARLRGYFAVLTLFALGSASEAFLLLRARELGVAVAMLPFLWSAFHVVKLVCSYFGGGWSDRLPRERLIVAGWLVYAAVFIALGLASERLHAWGLVLVYGAYAGLSEPAEKALVRDLAPAALRGRAYGVYNFIAGASALVAGVWTGWVWEHLGAPTALVCRAAIAIGACFALIVWARGERTSTVVSRPGPS
jgi:MFS family permease